MIYINSIDYIEEELIEQKERTEFLIELCDNYKKKNNKYINLPLPEDIIRKYDNDIGYGKYDDIHDLESYEEELEFYKYVSEHYDNNDFIITYRHFQGTLYDSAQLEKFYISPEVRRRVHGICDEIQQSIDQLKKEQ